MKDVNFAECYILIYVLFCQFFNIIGAEGSLGGKGLYVASFLHLIRETR